MGGGDSAWSLATSTILALAAALAGAELTMKLRHNRKCLRASEKGLGLHFYIAARSEEVQALMRTAEWKTHYRRSKIHDALWRYRCVPVWQSAAVCSQACSLLAWAWLVCPHCDGVLMIGAVANLLHILWRLCMAVIRCARRRRGPVALWFQALDDASSDSDGVSNAEEDGDVAVTESTGSVMFADSKSHAKTPRAKAKPKAGAGKAEASGNGRKRNAPEMTHPDQVTAATLGEPASELTGVEVSVPQPAVRLRVGRTSSSSKKTPPQLLAETADEQAQRLRIENMRRAEEWLSFAGS